MRKDTKGMSLESYAERIVTPKEPDDERNKKQIIQHSLQVNNTEMKMTSVNKIQFASLNNKRLFFGWYCVFTLRAYFTVKNPPDKKSPSKNSCSY